MQSLKLGDFHNCIKRRENVNIYYFHTLFIGIWNHRVEWTGYQYWKRIYLKITRF